MEDGYLNIYYFVADKEKLLTTIKNSLQKRH